MLQQGRNNLFISYSHADEKYLKELLIALHSLVRQDIIETWSDTDIRAGAIWRDEINKAIDSARVALLLVSANFFYSSFIMDEELPYIFKAEQKHQLEIHWISVEYCLYKGTEVAKYQPLNNPEKPLSSFGKTERPRELTRICEKIQQIFSPDIINQQVSSTTSSSSSKKASTQQKQQKADSVTIDLASMKLDEMQCRQLAQSLLKCGCMKSKDSRDLVVKRLPDDIHYSIERHPGPLNDAVSIVDGCNNYPGGLQKLIDIIRFFENNSYSMAEVDNTLHSFQ